MKTKTIAVLAMCALFAGCAQTTLYDRHTGKPIARFQGDMTGSHYADGRTVWDVQQVSHSAATLAQGRAASNVIGTVGSSVASAAIALGSSGLVPSAAAVALPIATSALHK